MDPLAAKLILDELAQLNRRFDESDRLFDEFHARIAQCLSHTVVVPEQRDTAVELRVGDLSPTSTTQFIAADNWGGLFDEDGDSITADSPLIPTVFPKPVPEADTASIGSNSEGHQSVPNRALVDKLLLSDGEDEIPSVDLSAPPTLFMEKQHADGREDLDEDKGKATVFPEGVPISMRHRDSVELPRLTNKEGRLTDQHERFERDGRPRPPWNRRPWGARPRRRPWRAPPHPHQLRRPWQAPPHRRGRPPRLLVRGRRPRLRARALLLHPGAVRHRVRAPPRWLRGRARGRLGPRRRRRPPRLLRGRHPRLRARAQLPQPGAICHRACAPPRRRARGNLRDALRRVRLPRRLLRPLPPREARVHTTAPTVLLPPRDVATASSLVVTAAWTTSGAHSIDAQVVFDEMQQRYISNFTSASWTGVILSGRGAATTDDDKVFEELSAQIIVLLEPLLAMVDKGPLSLHWFFNWKPPWFSFTYYQAVLKQHGKAIAGFLILGGFRWTAMPCLFPCCHCYGLGWQLSYLLRPSDNINRPRFNRKAPWPLLSLLQRPLWPPLLPPLPWDAAMASLIPTPRQASSMLLPAESSKSGATFMPTARLFDEMWSYRSGTAVATLTWKFSWWLGCCALEFINLMGSCINQYSWSLHMHNAVSSIEFAFWMSVWPQPHLQAEFRCGSTNVHLLTWPSFTLGDCSFMSQVCWKPPWPLTPRQGIHVGIGATLWLFPAVAWLPHWLCFHFLWKPPWQLQLKRVYLKERASVLKQVGNVVGRIHLTVQYWATSQTVGYISLVGQFIVSSSKWKLHQRMPHLVMVPWSCSENAVTEAINRSIPWFHLSVSELQLPNFRWVSCWDSVSAYVQIFCQELIYLGSYTGGHVTVLCVLSQASSVH